MWGREVQIRSTFFYADDGLITSTHPKWIQGEFGTLTYLFDRVELQTNVGKTSRICYQPFYTVGTQLEATYKRRMTGKTLTYQFCQK